MTNVIDVDASGSGKLTLGDQQHTVTEPTADKAAVALIGRVLAWSHHTGEDVALKALWMGVPTGLRVHPDWTVTEDRTLLSDSDEARQALTYVPAEPEPEPEMFYELDDTDDLDAFEIPEPSPDPIDQLPTVPHVDTSQGAAMTDYTARELEAHWHSDGTATVVHDGSTRHFTNRDDVLRYAATVGRGLYTNVPVHIRTINGTGPTTLVVDPDGRYYDQATPEDWKDLPAPITPPAPIAGARSPAVAPSHTPTSAAPDHAGSRNGQHITTESALAADEAVVHAGSEYVGRRKSFVDDTPPELPPSAGWRGAAAKLGIKVEVSDAERAERSDQEAVSQHWAGPRTIAVVNGKGGAGKTVVTICLAATFAKWGGIGVLAWDNNQTRGTLGWRTERAQHDSTTLDLIPAVERLRGPDAQMADLAHFVHHQKRDRFDVLRSQPLKLAADQRITPNDVENLHDVAAKYYRLIIMDSGNDESDPIWQEMIRHADQLVVATGTRADHAEAGALLLEALIDEGGRAAELATSSVVVITQGDAKATHDDMTRLRDGFSRLSREAVTIRHDQGMVDGALRLDNLKPTTQRDWLRSAAAVARGL
jgi:MinD-like ATPase involved in chromosome partitioning or flagellar assembly